MPQTRESQSTALPAPSLESRVKRALLWKSGSQIAAQLVMWGSTFLVIRLLSPADYGLFAMSQMVIGVMGLMSGYSLTGALVQAETIDDERVAQVFGLLILLNFGIAILQFAIAPWAADYFRQPIVADMLRVQCLMHLMTPFILMPQALLSRTIDFRTQARVNIGAALVAAIVAPAAAIAGMGVWTLIVAPLTLFGARAIGLALVGRWLIRPSFRFSGAGATFGFGGAMLVSELFWFAQNQADVFIAGRRFSAHDLGIYTTSLFLTQILINKFIGSLGEVAFPAYARMQAESGAVAWSFAKAVRVIMLVAVPFYLGLAVTAEPLVLVALGEKWAQAVPLVRLLALAMPFMTLHILYAPATNALGRPSIAAWNSAIGAVLMIGAYLIGARHGPIGLACAWAIGFPLLTIVTSAMSLPVIGLAPVRLIAAIAPSWGAAGVMALAVVAIDRALPGVAPLPRLLLLAGSGAAVYALVLLMAFRPLIDELIGLVRSKRAAA